MCNEQCRIDNAISALRSRWLSALTRASFSSSPDENILVIYLNHPAKPASGEDVLVLRVWKRAKIRTRLETCASESNNLAK